MSAITKQKTEPASVKTAINNAKLIEHSMALFALIFEHRKEEFSTEFIEEFCKVTDNFGRKLNRLVTRAQKETDSKKNESRREPG